MKNGGPRVSCVLPVFNGEKYIEEAITSILTQDYKAFQLIIVNDGSTDGTQSVLNRLAASDPRIEVIERTNGGIVAALNSGLKFCKGEFVARMDADDLAESDRFSFQVKYLDDHLGCVLVGGVAAGIQSDGTPAGKTTGGRHARTDLSLFPPKISVSVHPLVMIRSEALRKLGGYREEYPHAEDYDLFIRLSRLGTIDNPDRILLKYRRHEGAMSLKNLETQERSAARAERDAIAESGYKPVPDWFFERYVQVRIWRRYLSVSRAKARLMHPAIIRSLLLLKPSAIVSSRYWRLRLIILSGLFRDIRRRP